MTNIFENTKEVMYNNKEVKSITTENGGVIWENYPIILTTNDVTMSYRDGTKFIATVTKNGEPYGIGEKVTFNINNIYYPRQINSNGQAKINLNLNADTYTITSTFGGSTNTNTIIVSKASSTTSLSTSSSSILTTDTLTLTGEVTGTYIGGYSVKIYDESTLIDTVNVPIGSYSKSLTGLSVGTHTYKAVYEGGTNWNGSESSTVTVTVSEPAPVHDYSLSVASTKDILSYTDSDIAQITALLQDNGVAVEGETLSYEIKHGSTVIDSGSAVTDANGSISFNYTATAIGYIDIEITYGSLSNTYNLIDAKYYASNSRIDSEIINYSSTQHIFASTYEVKVGDEIHFRFKSQLPYRTVIGIGSTQGSDLTVEKVGSSYKLRRNVLNNVSNLNSRYAFTTTECDYVLKRVDESNQHRIWFFNECTSTLFDYYQCGTSIRKIRIDKFVGDYFEVEVFVL